MAETYDRTVKANSRTAIGGFFAYEAASCYRGPIPDIKIRRKPANGDLAIMIQETTLDKSTNCAGHRVKGPVYVYTPKKGFKGTDEVEIDIPFATTDIGAPTVFTHTYRIKVE